MHYNVIFNFLLCFLYVLGGASAQKIKLTEQNAEYCTGMYSRIDWGGSHESFIKVDLQSFTHADPSTDNASVALIVFEYRDIHLLGVVDGSGKRRYICDESLVREGLCSGDQLYQFIVDDNVSTSSPVKTDVLTSLGTNDFSYTVADTGYYCIAAFNPPYEDQVNGFNMIVNFHNAFGNLPAAEIPLLALYGLLAVVYAVCLAIYLFPVFRHRSELLLLQKYIAAFFVFLTVEDILTWSLYEVQNNNVKYPLPGGIQFYVVFISILNAFKISFSLFLLLIISLGYGIVHLKLPRKLMNICKLVCFIFFLFSAVFSCFSYFSSQAQPSASATDSSRSNNNTDLWVMIFVGFPKLLIFLGLYFWILHSLRKTTQTLVQNKQIVKLRMYQRLFRLITGSLLLLVFALVLTTILVAKDSYAESVERFWKFNDVLTSFWPACIYFIVFVGIAIIWRPTDTSYLLAASSQLPTSVNGALPQGNNTIDLEQDDFEFDDLRSLDSNLDPFESNNNSRPSGFPQSADNPFADSNKLANPFDDTNKQDLNNRLNEERLKNADNTAEFGLADETEDEDHENEDEGDHIDDFTDDKKVSKV